MPSWMGDNFSMTPVANIGGNIAEWANIDCGLRYEVSVPGVGFRELQGGEFFRSNIYSGRLSLPVPSRGDVDTLQIVTQDNSRVVGYTFVPIRDKQSGTYREWILDIP